MNYKSNGEVIFDYGKQNCHTKFWTSKRGTD